MPTVNESSSAVPTAKSVHGSTDRMIDMTGVPVDRNELPRSPLMASLMKRMYCSWNGASRSIEKRLKGEESSVEIVSGVCVERSCK